MIAALERMKNSMANTERGSNIQLNAPRYECDLCRDTEYISFTKDGYSYAKPCECKARKDNLRRIKNSGLSNQIEKCTFGTFEVTEAWQEVIKNRALSFLDTAGNWFFIGGQVGSGKTHICTAIAGVLLEKHKLKYMLWRDEAVKLKACVNNDSEYLKMITPLKDCQILYIDDFFKCAKGGGVTVGDINVAFEIINYRYNSPELITIVSSEFSIDEIIEFDEATGSRIKQRAGEYCTNISKNRDKNYRLKS